MPCVTVPFDPKLGAIITAGVAIPTPIRDPKEKVNIRTVRALVDTGATITCITPAFADEVGLPLIGKTTMISASETRDVNLYLASFFIPFGEPGKATHGQVDDMPMMEFNMEGDQFQMLLGRDILCRGVFQMVGYDRRFMFCL